MSASIKGGAKLAQFLNDLTAKAGKQEHVNVGFLEGATYPDGTSVVEVAAKNEFGGAQAAPEGYKTATVYVPPRPFMRLTVERHSGEWPQIAEKILKNTNYDMQKTMTGIGIVMQGNVQDTIETSSLFRPNAPYTIKKKGYDAPLQHTKHMRDSVDFEVKDGLGDD